MIIQLIGSQFLGDHTEMLPSNTEKKNLIEAMKKLTYQISNNPQRQKQIFESLAANDLIKIVQNLYDDNEYLRRISALLLCELFYNNNQLKLAMVEKLCLPLSYGRICLNRIPDSAHKNPPDVKKCLDLMKSSLRKGENEMFCWAINLDKKHLDLELFEFKKYSSFTFLDPQRTIFGFTVISPEQEHQIPESPATISLETTLKTQRRESSQDSKFDSEVNAKKYLGIRKFQQIRPMTSLTSREKQHLLLSSSKQKEYSFQRHQQQTHPIAYSNPNTNTYMNTNTNISAQLSSSIGYQQNKQKLGTSIQSISQYARNSYGRQNTDRIREKQRQRQRYSLSFTNDINLDSTQLNTDRYQTKKSTQLESSIGKIRANSKTPQNHHENFYKRVQEILRK